MECSLFALIACFSWSNLYVDAQISYRDEPVPYHYWKEIAGPPPGQTGAIESNYFLSTIGSDNQNPYYRPAIGIRLPFRSIDVSAEAFYESNGSSKTDRGAKGIALRMQWFPFR